MKTRRIIKAQETQIRTTIKKSRVAFVKQSICQKHWFSLRVAALALKEDAVNKKSKKSTNYSRNEKYFINGKNRIPHMGPKIVILRR